MANKGGLHGFQWLLIIEGSLTVLWGLMIWVRHNPVEGLSIDDQQHAILRNLIVSSRT